MLSSVELASPTEGEDMEPMSANNWTNSMLEREKSGFLCKIDTEYQQDKFNWTDIQQRFDFVHFQKAAHLLLERPIGKSNYLGELYPLEPIEKEAAMLYGLLHARFIMTDAGCCEMVKHTIKYHQLDTQCSIVREKFLKQKFGVCPRLRCDNQPVLPIGTEDSPCVDFVKVYCPKCRDIYYPYKEHADRLDGAFFGTGFPHHFFMVYPELRPLPCSTRPLDMEESHLGRMGNQAAVWSTRSAPHITLKGSQTMAASDNSIITSQSLSSTGMDDRMDTGN